MKLLIGIPAYNEDKAIGRVIQSIPKKIAGIKKLDILVVDDGSGDSTGSLSRSLGAQVVTHLINRGLGGALKTIFAFARYGNYDVLLTLDADGQHETKEIPKLVEKVIDGTNDVVIGTRWKDAKNVLLARLIVNKLANLLTYLFFGIWSSDTQSGFRCFSKKAINCINIISDGMEVSSEFFKEIYRNKLCYREVPIKAIYTHYSQTKGQQLTNSFNVFFNLLIRFMRE